MANSKTDSAKHRFDCQLLPARSSPKQAKGDRSATPIVKIVAEPGQFIFYLNQSVLSFLELVQSGHYTLQIPADLISALRQYALVDDEGHFQSGFTFCTHYTDPLKTWQSNVLPRSGQFVLRSVISLDGDVIYQVSHDFLQHPLCAGVASVHHWLIQELMGYLRSNTGLYLKRILQLTPIVVVGATTLTNLIGLATNVMQDPVVIMQPILMSCLSFSLPMAEKQITSWVKTFIFSNLLNPATLAGRIAKWVIGRLS